MSRFDILITYDVNTETPEGRKRLRQVAIACKDYGQRVQKSVFECRVTQSQYETLSNRLRKIIKPNQDSIRFYKLLGGRDNCVESFGIDNFTDLDDPLII
jgi:CRISPR-associated protein Cas2